jgi:hypothetical protein
VPGFYGNLYILALMDLFGLFKVEQPRQPITPWLPARVERTPFGDAVLTLLNDSILEILFGEDDGPANQPHFGAWQSLFQPYFPEWKRNLELPKAEARAGVFIFRASLGKIWRRFAMPAESTLGDLFTMIRRSVEFDDDHLYEFRYIDQFGAEVTAGHPRMDEGPWADDIAVGSLPLAPGQEMQLTYDFGDNWQFKVKLERIETNDPTVKEPTLLESHGEAPEQYPSWDD